MAINESRGLPEIYTAINIKEPGRPKMSHFES